MVRQLTPKDIAAWKENFMCIVSSPRRSGKTWLVDWLFSCFAPQRFAAVYCISPTSLLQGAFAFLPDQFHIMPTKETFASDVQRIIDFQRTRKEKGKELSQVCLILDDCCSSSSRGYGVGKISEVLENIASRGRHFGISVILLSQRIYSISPSIRSNADIMISFYPRTQKAREHLITQYLSRENTGTKRETRERALKILAEVFDGKDSGQYRALVIYPDSRERTLDGICAWVEAPTIQHKWKLVLKHVKKTVEKPSLMLTGINYLS